MNLWLLKGIHYKIPDMKIFEAFGVIWPTQGKAEESKKIAIVKDMDVSGEWEPPGHLWDFDSGVWRKARQLQLAGPASSLKWTQEIIEKSVSDYSSKSPLCGLQVWSSLLSVWWSSKCCGSWEMQALRPYSEVLNWNLHCNQVPRDLCAGYCLRSLD